MAKTIGQLTQTTTIAGGDEFVIEQSGQTKRVAASVVRGDISDTNIASNAAIAFSKLAALDSGNILVGNGSNVATKVAVTGDVTISNAGVTTLARPYTLATAQASTSGTEIDFTGIPSWAKRITVMLSGVSTNGTSGIVARLGVSAGFVSSGYLSSALVVGNNIPASVANNTSGFVLVPTPSATSVAHITCVICNVSGNSWISSHLTAFSDSSFAGSGGGSVSLASVLTQLRITTVNGTDTFDAGSINISYEG